MATLLDLGIMQHFGSIFVVFLIFAIIFGVLEATKPFGDGKKGIHAVIGLFIALLLLLSSTASGMIKTMVPWFIVVIVFLFFVMLLFRMFGVDDSVFKKVVGDPAVYPWIIIFSLLVLFGALAAVFGQSFLEVGGGPTDQGTSQLGPDGVTIEDPGIIQGTSSTSTGSFATNVLNTFRHPKILGMVFVFLTGAFMMIFLTKPITPPG
jgi:hypothetical protein